MLFASKSCIAPSRRTNFPMPTPPFDLVARARQAMIEAGFHPDFPADVLAEMKDSRTLPAQSSTRPQDLRTLLWSSIDNETSRDLDQIECAERNPDGSYRLLIGIADVDALVPKASNTDRYAADETTSIYT